MLKLENINLCFKRNLIENGELTIPDGMVTVITGASGSGKTSLLYLIGLISTNVDYLYTFDGCKVNLTSDKEVSALRKHRIGYVFQDNSVIDCMTVRDNIRYAAKIAGVPITDEEISGYLSMVRLDISEKKYPKVLSGGEQQRLAIACAMAKKPDLIIADEPTSALDAGNSQIIMEILSKYAREEHKKVVIASHSEIVCKFADVVYEISDCKIICMKDKVSETKQAKQNIDIDRRKHLGIGFALRYAFRSSNRGKIQKLLMIVLCAIAIAFAANVSGIGDGFISYQKSLLDKISDRQVFLINFTAPLQTYVDVDENISICDEDVGRIASVSSIESYYPYFEFRSTGYNLDRLDFFNTSIVTIETEQGTREYTFDSYADSEYNTIAILPYYNEENIEARVDNVFSVDNQDNTVYLSYQLAQILGVTTEEKTKVHLNLELGVPVFTTNVDLMVSNAQSGYIADIDVSVINQFNLEIAGVLDYSYTNKYSASGNNAIYMPVDMMLRYLEDAIGSNKDHGAVDGIVLNEWKPSAYTLFLKNYNDIAPTIQKLESINPNFKAVSGYQDIMSMNEMMSSVKNTATYIIVVVLAIVLVLMTIIYVNHTMSRKFEIAVLKANGLNRQEILNVALAESFLQMSAIAILALIFSWIVERIINMLFSFDVIDFSVEMVMVVLSISMVSVIIPTIGSVIAINRIKPDKIMRN